MWKKLKKWFNLTTSPEDEIISEHVSILKGEAMSIVVDINKTALKNITHQPKDLFMHHNGSSIMVTPSDVIANWFDTIYSQCVHGFPIYFEGVPAEVLWRLYKETPRPYNKDTKRNLTLGFLRKHYPSVFDTDGLQARSYNIPLDLRMCERDDTLVTNDGQELRYLGRSEDNAKDYHVVEYPSNKYQELRHHNGMAFMRFRFNTDNDIVKIQKNGQ